MHKEIIMRLNLTKFNIEDLMKYYACEKHSYGSETYQCMKCYKCNKGPLWDEATLKRCHDMVQRTIFMPLRCSFEKYIKRYYVCPECGEINDTSRITLWPDFSKEVQDGEK